MSVFLVNYRRPAPDDRRDEAFAFQVQLSIHSPAALTPQPNLRGMDTNDWDVRVADLQYRDCFEYAVGHSIATTALVDEQQCHDVRTCWIPESQVEKTAVPPMDSVELSMLALSVLKDADEAGTALGGFADAYRSWIEVQRSLAPDSPTQRAETSAELLSNAERAAARIQFGVDLLRDPVVLDAFRIANRVMATQAARRLENPDPKWRPFQLAFLLMNMAAIIDPKHDDREIVDLLFFPTGGGKTEAYLGLAAFTLVLRRMRNPGVTGAGVSVIMRYTLRLLTLDQLGRAAALICALELEREKDVEKLGDWPFEIALWVGQAATPNRMGRKGDGNNRTARAKTIAFQNNDRGKPSSIPLEVCPWCNSRFTKHSFKLVPNESEPIDLRVNCMNRDCDFSGRSGRNLPIVSVDEPVYRRLPCFMIATVDKFAALPWTGEVGKFFGKADRYDQNGFYGPVSPGVGRRLESGQLPPPDLIIQDELHLISGPLGTVAGLYETAMDELASREIDGKTIRPKIIASTATVRRADDQIRALFARNRVDVFPPPGPDRRDSFFAKTVPASEANARLYVGVAAQGRPTKKLFLRANLAVMAAAQKLYSQFKRDKNNPADPYMTMLGYFNSLRELGGSRRLCEDEVSNALAGYGIRMRLGEEEGIFQNRKIGFDVLELTSRVSTDKVAEAKRRLEQEFSKGKVDIALATNMISVGLDIPRLGLMVVFGQPKTSSEYIQATSRVGRDDKRPGLVVTLLNLNRPRDRSHYERFSSYHETFYRSVEATSVTPFSPRAMDRALAGTLVALARQGFAQMTPPRGAQDILETRNQLSQVTEVIVTRVVRHTRKSGHELEELQSYVRNRCEKLLDSWYRIADELRENGVDLQYQKELGNPRRLLYEFLNPELATVNPRFREFRANRSMRDVEPEVNLWVRTLDNRALQEETNG